LKDFSSPSNPSNSSNSSLKTHDVMKLSHLTQFKWYVSFV